MQEKDKKSGASVNANSFAAPIKPTVVNTEQMDNTDKTIHPLFTSYCKPPTIVRSYGSVRQIQGCIGGYTRVYAVYQPPIYLAGVYSPQLLYIKRVYAGYTPCKVAYVCPNYSSSR